MSSDVCWCNHVRQAHWNVGGCKRHGCGCQEYGPKPTAEERAAFKRQEREAAAAIMAGDRYCPDPSAHGAGRAVQDDGLPTVDWAAKCKNCHHPYAQHTSRSLRPDSMERLPGSRLGPIVPRWGGGCEATAYPRSDREDWHHTCPCSAFRAAPPLHDPQDAREDGA